MTNTYSIELPVRSTSNNLYLFLSQAVANIKDIEQRLKGLIHGRQTENVALHLSVEGQINHLILEATSVDNLCQMYFGWGAYL